MGLWRDPEFTMSNHGMMGVMGSIFVWLGVISVVLGIISQAIDTTIGFEPMFWLVLGVASLLFSLGCWLGWAVGMYLHVLETRSKKE